MVYLASFGMKSMQVRALPLRPIYEEEEILKLLAEKSLTLNGLVNKWNELNSKEKHYKEDHFEILKERIFEMIKDEKIKQSFEFTEVLLRINK